MMGGMTRKTAVFSSRAGWVVPQYGSAEGRVFSIMDSAVLGSGQHAQIRITADGVSPAHAKILDDGESFWLLANHGASGITQLNGKVMTSGSRAKLADGDVIELGHTALVFKSL